MGSETECADHQPQKTVFPYWPCVLCGQDQGSQNISFRLHRRARHEGELPQGVTFFNGGKKQV